jgi:hypothetical protein
VPTGFSRKELQLMYRSFKQVNHEARQPLFFFFLLYFHGRPQFPWRRFCMASLIWERGDSIFIENLIKMVSRSMGTRSRSPAGGFSIIWAAPGSRLPTPLTQNLSDSNRLKTSRSYCTQVLCCAANEEWRKSFPFFPFAFFNSGN